MLTVKSILYFGACSIQPFEVRDKGLCYLGKLLLRICRHKPQRFNIRGVKWNLKWSFKYPVNNCSLGIWKYLYELLRAEKNFIQIKDLDRRLLSLHHYFRGPQALIIKYRTQPQLAIMFNQMPPVCQAQCQESLPALPMDSASDGHQMGTKLSS